MIAKSYQQLALDWHPESRRDKSFLFFALFMLVAFIGLGVLMDNIDVPKQAKREKVVVPERVAKFIMEKPKVVKKQPPKPKAVKPPPPKPKEVKKEPPKPKDPKKVTVKKQRKEQPKKLTKKQEKARETASQSGLLALSNDLSDLMDTSGIDNMVGTKIAKVNTNSSNNGAGNATPTANQANDILTADATKRSGGVNAKKVLTAKTGSNVQLAKASGGGQQSELLAARADTEIVKSKKKAKSSGKAKTERTGNYRPEEDIALVMDQNKSKLHALYRKARRTNPGIEGKIVLEITISPAGKVLNVKVKSSELNDKKLESRIVARVKRFSFGAANVKPVTVTYPIEFLPS